MKTIFEEFAEIEKKVFDSIALNYGALIKTGPVKDGDVVTVNWGDTRVRVIRKRVKKVRVAR